MRICILGMLLVHCTSGWGLASEGAGGEGASVEAGGKSGSPVFQGYFGESIWTLVSFTLLLVVLWKVAWKPLLARLQERESYITKQISDAEKIRKDAEAVLNEYRAKLAAAEKEGGSIISRHLRQAEEQAREVTARAQKELDLMRQRMESDLERARVQAEKDLLAESGRIILALGREILGRTITTDDNQRMVDDAVGRLKLENQAKNRN